MSDLVSRLLAAIEETEQAARACGGAPWVDDVPAMVHVDPVAIRDSKWSLGHLGYVASADNSPIGDAYRAHIVRNDPASVLRRCAADRRLLKRLVEVSNPQYLKHSPGVQVLVEFTLGQLAAGYGISVEE